MIDEHGRQLGQGRNLAPLKAEWGAKARGAFQALASLKLDEATQSAAKSQQNQPPAQSGKAPVAPKTRSLPPRPRLPKGRAALHGLELGELPS
nr:hypothetical protein [Comamonas jiangduensis]